MMKSNPSDLCFDHRKKKAPLHPVRKCKGCKKEKSFKPEYDKCF